jgi:hypothetical protein
MDTFIGVPSNTSSVKTLLSPFVPVTPILTVRPRPLFEKQNIRIVSPLRTNINMNYDALLTKDGAYIYDSGIGRNPLVQDEINNDMRYKFLDKFLYEDFEDIVRRLKLTESGIKVVSKSESQTNDISKDTVAILEKKSDFIGDEILTISKVGKIMRKILNGTSNLRYYDLPHNEYYVMKAFAKYIRSKLDEMK